MTALKRNPFMLDRIKYTQRGMLTEEILAEILEVERVVVGKAISADQAMAPQVPATAQPSLQ
jgi:hypothetical protein